MQTSPPHHLVAVWNPSYAHDPMDEHLRILAEWNERFHRGEAKAEDVYVADDTVATIEELARLRNVRYHLAPVSLYGGMTDLPLIVDRPEPRLWFADDGRLTEGRLWAEHDLAMRGETDKMSRELRENLFGDDVWRQLEYSTRVFLATAEATFRARRHDPAYDFSAPGVEYAKAIETEANALIFRPLRKLYSKGNSQGRRVRVNEGEVDLGDVVPHQSLGTIVTMLDKNNEMRKAIPVVFQQKADADFIMGELSTYLGQIADRRNPAAHSAKMTREDCLALRERIMGIGQEGMISRIARAKMRST